MPIVPYGYSKWTFWLRHFEIQVNKPGVRYVNKFDVTMEEWQNLFEKKCWCGKSKHEFDRFQIRYCTPKHASIWTQKTLDWNSFRYKIIKRDNFHCTECGISLRTYRSEYSYEEIDYEVDHIQAIILGGMCFDESNVRTLCGPCHKVKTKSDMGILASWRRISNYDIGPIIPDPQLTLDNIMELDYAFS